MKNDASKRRKAARLALAFVAAGTIGSSAQLAYAATCCNTCVTPGGTYYICVNNCGSCGFCGNCCVWGINCS
jgi:hypothetical protein